MLMTIWQLLIPKTRMSVSRTKCARCGPSLIWELLVSSWVLWWLGTGQLALSHYHRQLSLIKSLSNSARKMPTQHLPPSSLDLNFVVLIMILFPPTNSFSSINYHIDPLLVVYPTWQFPHVLISHMQSNNYLSTLIHIPLTTGRWLFDLSITSRGLGTLNYTSGATLPLNSMHSATPIGLTALRPTGALVVTSAPLVLGLFPGLPVSKRSLLHPPVRPNILQHLKLPRNALAAYFAWCYWLQSDFSYNNYLWQHCNQDPFWRPSSAFPH